MSLHGERYETRGEAEEKRRMFLKQCSVRRDVEGEKETSVTSVGVGDTDSIIG